MVQRFCISVVALSLALSVCLIFPRAVMAIDLSRFYDHYNSKRSGDPASCRPYEPFKCPGDGTCISIQYLCDGAPDCQNGYDEDSRLCTAAKRPPVEETASFLQSLLASHGPNYLEKLFGTKAREALKHLGGVDAVAIALSESQSIEDFGAALHLMRADLEYLRGVFVAVENGDMAKCQGSARFAYLSAHLYRRDPTRSGTSRQGKARQGKARQGKARQGKARSEQTRSDQTRPDPIRPVIVVRALSP